jgi:hypothetical protein
MISGSLRKPKRLGYSGGMNAKQMGRKGGKAKSAAKLAAVRRNGLLGGRPKSAERFARELRELHARLCSKLPKADPDDLGLIAERMLRPVSQRRFFIYPRKGGGYVF